MLGGRPMLPAILVHRSPTPPSSLSHQTSYWLCVASRESSNAQRQDLSH
ncbi:Uncharacterised protein [Vibrio cholerae]|nr:Uncharacterised protein [Vibrio cholerae]